MNTNEEKFIGRAQADGENATDKAQADLDMDNPVISDIVEAELIRLLSDERKGR